MQFVFAPILGRLSDRIGRRPVLLLSTAGACISYAVFAFGSGLQGRNALLVLFISRAFAGLCGANIGVAQAYIADITPPAERSKRMGLIGMAFGLGFIFGPLIGGVSQRFLGFTGPGWVAATLCAANFLLAFFILPESWKPSAERTAPRPHLEQWLHTMGKPKVGLLIGVFFLATFCFTCFESTIGLLIMRIFSLDPKGKQMLLYQGYLFAYSGFIGALIQGGATGRLVKALGEPKLIGISLVLAALGMAPLPYAGTWGAVLGILAVLAIGTSLTRPPVFGMISNLTPPDEQGVTIGVAQSMGSLARILGPLIVVPLFYHDPRVPYLACAVISVVTGFVAWVRLSRDYDPLPAATRVETANPG
jgi:multidrug resistance protein